MNPDPVPPEDRKPPAREKQSRWRPSRTAVNGRRATLPARLGWTLAAVALMAMVPYLVIPPLFIWHAAVVELSIDEYAIGTLLPVPFGKEDAAAISSAVRGGLSPGMGREVLALDSFTSTPALRDELGARMAALPLRQRDVLIAMIRAQTIVAAAANDGRINDGTRACVLASDLTLSGNLPEQRVSCRDIIGSFAESKARTILVTLDMGDIRWDPRLGVLSSVVPEQLDREFAVPFADDGGSRRDCWVLGSHDTTQFSGVSLTARRSFFARGLELALAGEADDPQQGGNGDGVVELDELVGFTAAWTSAWAMHESHAESNQCPVLWKVGTGRVPIDAVPRGIALVRVIRTANSPTWLPRLQISAPPAGEAKPAVAPPPAAAPAEESSRPDADSGAVGGMWALLEQTARRPTEASSSPVDYAPHAWRQVMALAAMSAEAQFGNAGDGKRNAGLELQLEKRLAAFNAPQISDATAGDLYPLEQLTEARRRSQEAGWPAAWRRCPTPVIQALTMRNDAIELCWASVAWTGMVSGGTGAAPLAGAIGALIDSVAALQQQIETIVDPAGGSLEDRSETLAAGCQAVEVATVSLRSGFDAIVERVLARGRRTAEPLSSAELRWLAASRLLTPSQRRSLETLVSERTTPPAVPEEGEKSSSAQSAVDRWLPITPSRPRRAVSVNLLDRSDINRLAEKLRITHRLIAMGGNAGPRMARSLAEIDAGVDRLVMAAEAADRPATLVDLVGVGKQFAEAMGSIPSDIESLMGGRRDETAAVRQLIDSLLRLADPRDSRRIHPDAQGFVPEIRAVPQSAFVVASDAPRLSLTAPRSATVSMVSGHSFPPDALLRLVFDADILRVETAAGRRIVSGEAIDAVVDRPGDRIGFGVTAVRPAGTAGRAAPLTVVLESGSRRDERTFDFELPSLEIMQLAVRGKSAAMEGVVDADGWLRRAIEPLISPGPVADRLAAAAAGRATGPVSIELRPFPGHGSAWEFALSNQTGVARRVAVDLITWQETSATADPIEHADHPDHAEHPDHADRDRWAGLAKALKEGDALPEGFTRIAAVSDLSVPAEGTQMALELLPPMAPPPVSATPAVAGASPSKPAEAVSAERLIPPQLALVVRDRTAVETGPPTDGAPADAGGLVAVAKEDARLWLVPIRLRPQHPRRYVDATARWSREDRSIVIDLRPRGDETGVLPTGITVIRGEPLRAEVARGEPVMLRKPEAALSVAQPTDFLRAQWDGVEDALAWLSLDIDGYPRARVFRVACSAAAVGIEQRPQEDWRQVEIVEPKADYAAYRAPAAAIRLALAIDGPADAFLRGRADEAVEVSVREIRDLEGGLPDQEQIVWRGAADRQVALTLKPSQPPHQLTVVATVSDLEIPLALGYRDVDVVVTVRLRVPGEMEPRTASRRIVLDGSPPRIDVAKRLQSEKGKEAVLAVRCEDGVEDLPLFAGRRPGASGVDRVEWGIDAKLNAAPEKWLPATIDNDGVFQVAIPTDGLAVGRHRVVVRAFDRVGWESAAETCELEVVAPPPPPPPASAAPADPRNSIAGSVTLAGKPQPNIAVIVAGPDGSTTVRSGPDGKFVVPALKPGEYKLSVQPIAIRNKFHKVVEKPVMVSPPPAKPASVVLVLE